MMHGKLYHDQYLVDKFGPFVGKDFFSLLLFHFITPKWCGSDFSSKLQLPKMPGKLKHDQSWVDKLGPFMGTDFFSFFSSSLFHFLPVTLNLAYFAPLNGACRIFPVNLNYKRCLKNSKMINSWLISLVTLW